MVELITTAIIALGSGLLFGYWLRCAILLLLRGEYRPPETPMLSSAGSVSNLATRTPLLQSTAGIS
jgi:hypothetical protein